MKSEEEFERVLDSMEFAKEFLSIVDNLNKQVFNPDIDIELQEEMGALSLEIFMKEKGLDAMQLVWGLCTVIDLQCNTLGIDHQALLNALDTTIAEVRERFSK